MGFGFCFFGWDTLLTCARALQCAITTWWVPGTQKCKFFENKWKLLGSGAFLVWLSWLLCGPHMEWSVQRSWWPHIKAVQFFLFWVALFTRVVNCGGPHKLNAQGGVGAWSLEGWGRGGRWDPQMWSTPGRCTAVNGYYYLGSFKVGWWVPPGYSSFFSFFF